MAGITAYQTLLLDFTPRPIHSEREYHRAIRRIECLLDVDKLARAESELLELLSTLVEQYESQTHPIPAADQAETLEFLLESRELTRAELARQTGIPRSTITNVLNGRRSLSKANIRELANFFHVSADILLPG